LSFVVVLWDPVLLLSRIGSINQFQGAAFTKLFSTNQLYAEPVLTPESGF
jgi:hypothetical protein